MNESKATRYQRSRRRVRAVGLISGGLMLALIALTPASRVLSGWAEDFGRGLPALPHAVSSLVLYIIVLVVIWELAVLPAALYLCLEVDARYGQRRPSVDEVLAAQAQATLVALPAAFFAAGTVQIAVWLAGAWWWPLAGLLLSCGLVAGLHGAPALLSRLAGARALARPGLTERLADLARRARVPVAGVDELPVSDGRTTALVTGAGRSRRIFVASELACHWSEDEIAVVVAHELAHHAHHDLRRTLVMDASLLSLALGLADRLLTALSTSPASLGPGGWALGTAKPGDLAALPLIALVAGTIWLAATPIRNAYSRRQERRADQFALALTGGADAFSAAIRRLGARHLAEERPSVLTQWLYHRHPSVAERLATAARHKTDPL